MRYFLAFVTVDYEGGTFLGAYNTDSEAAERIDNYRKEHYVDRGFVLPVEIGKEHEVRI